MKKKKIWLSSPHMGDQEQKFVADAFETNWIAPIGPNVNSFEEELADYLSSNVYIVALNSGTAAIHLALILAGVKEGDTVLCQSLTFSASANPIVYQRANPVFIDSETDTWNMDPELLKQAILEGIKNGNKPKACIVVDLYGMPAKFNEIKSICEKYEVKLIEDSAEALGSSINSLKAGTFGDFGILSFNGNKIITSSGGGALICKNQEDATKAKFLATQSRDAAPHYQHSQLGFNYRLSNVCAGIGRGQLRVLNERVISRRKNYEYYLKMLGEKYDISFQVGLPTFYSNRWLTTVLFNSYEIRENVRLALANENIESRPIWKPMHLQPFYQSCYCVLSGVSNDIFEKGLCLPSGSNLKLEDLETVVRTIRNVVC